MSLSPKTDLQSWVCGRWEAQLFWGVSQDSWYKPEFPISVRYPLIDWCCFYYFLRNTLVALLEALFARHYVCGGITTKKKDKICVPAINGRACCVAALQTKNQKSFLLRPGDLTLNVEGCGCTEKRPHADCKGPPPTWIHTHNLLSCQRALVEPRSGGCSSAIVCPVSGCFGRLGSMEDGHSGDWLGRTGRHALSEHGKDMQRARAGPTQEGGKCIRPPLREISRILRYPPQTWKLWKLWKLDLKGRQFFLEFRFRGTKSFKVGNMLTDWLKREVPWRPSEKVQKKGSWRSLHREKRKRHRFRNHNWVRNPEEEGEITGLGEHGKAL